MSPPPIDHSCVWLVPSSAWTSGAPSSSAFSGSTTTGSGSYSTTHLLGGVDDGVLVVADDDRDGLADVLDLALGERPVLGRLDLDARRDPGHRQRRVEVEVLAGEDAVDAGRSLRAPEVSIETIFACASGERTTAM